MKNAPLLPCKTCKAECTSSLHPYGNGRVLVAVTCPKCRKTVYRGSRGHARSRQRAIR